MRVGVVDGHAVDVLEHAVGQNAVQIARDDDGNIRPHHAADLCQQIAFRVRLALGRHGAMH